MKLKNVISNAFDAMLRSYEGKKFWPSLILRLVYALISAVFTALFADTLFSKNNTVNQIFSALFFYFLLVSVGKLITECKRGGCGKRLKAAFVSMVQLKPPALWWFLGAVAVALFLPYAFVLSLALLLFCSAASADNSLLLQIKNAVAKGKSSAQSGRGLAACAGGLLACGLVVCILANLGAPTLYGVLDGSGPRRGIAQTDTSHPEDTAPPLTSSDADRDPDAAAPSGDTVSSVIDSSIDQSDHSEENLRRIAAALTDKLIHTAGGDRAEFRRLFRNTNETVIDQYYNTSYDQFKKMEHSLVALAAADEYNVWFTTLYYTIPAEYPAAKEQAVYLSAIMNYNDGGWRLLWNDEVRAELQEDFDNATFTPYGYAAKEDGRPWAKFFIPFRPFYETLLYDDAVLCKVIEMYIHTDGDLHMTLYVTNDTGAPVTVDRIDRITVTDGDRTLFSRSFDLGFTVESGSGCQETLIIPADGLEFDTWSSPKIADFRFCYESR